jgi:hypothetical protein
MSSFTQGLDILLRQLRNLDSTNRPRFDQSIIDRINELKIEGPVGTSSRSSEQTVGMSSRSSEQTLGTNSESAVGTVREDTHPVIDPDEQELVPTGVKKYPVSPKKQ